MHGTNKGQGSAQRAGSHSANQARAENAGQAEEWYFGFETGSEGVGVGIGVLDGAPPESASNIRHTHVPRISQPVLIARLL